LNPDDFEGQLYKDLVDTLLEHDRVSLAMAEQAVLDALKAANYPPGVTVKAEPPTQEDIDLGQLRYTMTFPVPVYTVSLPPLESDEFATLLTCDECGKTTDRIDFESNRPLCEDCDP